MPSKVVTALVTAVEIAAERENAAVLAKSMTIDNQDGLTDRIITLQDSFNESAYYGNVTLTGRLPSRFQAKAVAGDMITLGEADLKGVKCLGTMQVICNVADEAGGATDHCYVTVGYEHE